MSAQSKKFVQSEIGALKDIHENANRNAANDLIRHDQECRTKKIVKTVQSEESNYEESDYNEKNKI